MTLSELFHGNMGRMLFIRVMLHLKRPDLAQMDKGAPLDDSLAEQIRKAILEVSRV